MELKSKAGK